MKLLNNILQTFIDPTSFVANRQLINNFKFEKDHVLSNVIQTYVNLDVLIYVIVGFREAGHRDCEGHALL